MVVSRSYFFERVFAGPLEEGCRINYYIQGHRMPSGVDYTIKGCVDSLQLLDEVVNNAADQGQYNTYYGVCPAKGLTNHKESIAYAGCAWADLDAKAIGSKKEAYERVWNGDFARPTFLVDSGNGYHAYWCFIRPCRDLEGVEAINQYIASAVGADHCHNINRLLRVPGTINYKDPKNPKPCRIVQYSGFIYDYDFFPKQDVIARPKQAEADIKQVQVNKTDLPLMFQRVIEFGYVLFGYSGIRLHPDGTIDRSRTDFVLSLELMREGLSDDQIGSLFLDPANGISEKTYSHPTAWQQARYVRRLVGRARIVFEEG